MQIQQTSLDSTSVLPDIFNETVHGLPQISFKVKTNDIKTENQKQYLNRQ